MNGKAKHEPNASRKERPQKRGGGGRFEPYGNVNKRYRVFVSNIPYDVKWQALKDLMKDKGKVWMDDQVQLMKKTKQNHRILLCDPYTLRRSLIDVGSSKSFSRIGRFWLRSVICLMELWSFASAVKWNCTLLSIGIKTIPVYACTWRFECVMQLG